MAKLPGSHTKMGIVGQVTRHYLVPNQVRRQVGISGSLKNAAILDVFMKTRSKAEKSIYAK